MDAKTTAVLAALTVSALYCFGGVLYWDADGDPSGNSPDGAGLGGTGEWSAAASWWDGADASVSWSGGSAAVFSGTPGTVTLDAAVSASNVRFDAGGYVIDLNKNSFTTAGIEGAPAEIKQSSGSTASVEFCIPDGTTNVWGGSISGQISVKKTGRGTLELSGPITTVGSYIPVDITEGTLRFIGATGGNNAGGYTYVRSGAVFDIGDTPWSTRMFSTEESSTLTGNAMVYDGNSWQESSFRGYVTGGVGITVCTQAEKSYVISCPTNDYTGGTWISFNNGGSSEFVVEGDRSLGLGPVCFQNNRAEAVGRFKFTSANPEVGALRASSTGRHEVLLASTNEVTRLTVGALGTDDIFNGYIYEEGTTGSVVKTGSGVWTLSGTNTYSGVTVVESGEIAVSGSVPGFVEVLDGGAFCGLEGGEAFFPLGEQASGITVRSGRLDVSLLNARIDGEAVLDRYVLVDYSDGGEVVFAQNPDTRDSFAGVSGIPSEARLRHDREAKIVELIVPAPASVLMVR